MTFLAPLWLALAVPALTALWWWRPPVGPRRGLRFALTALVVLALARPAALLPRRGGTVVVVADRSSSMPADAATVELEAVRRLLAERGGGDRVAVVSVGARAAVERLPAGGRFDGWTAEVGPHATSLADGLETALALVPTGDPGRLLLLSDGRSTGRDVAPVVAKAALRGIPVDFRALERPTAGDLAVERIDAPGRVSPGEGFLVSAWIRSPTATTVRYRLTRGETLVAEGRRTVAAGKSRLTFRDRADPVGVLGYRLEIAGDGAADPVPENDQARFLVGVEGPRPVLVLSRPGGVGLARLLAAGGLAVEQRSSEVGPLDLAALSGYSAVLLENVAAEEVTLPSLEALASWVRVAGGGLLQSGGERSFGPGGYYKSPLEPVLPVSMELRREHRKLSVAMAIVLDRSGSMAVDAGGGKTKMDLADLAAAEVVSLLGPADELAVIAVDSEAHVVVPRAPLTDPEAVRAKVLRIDSMGGGIFVYTGLVAAISQLATSEAAARHVLLFADAADAEEPGEYESLLAKARAAGVTVSVIGLGTPADVDAPFLRDVARRGEGRVFFSTDAMDLPRLFAQDTFSVVRSAFVPEPTPIRLTPSLRALVGVDLAAGSPPPPAGGYSLTYLRPSADLLALTEDEEKAPFVAAWPVGLGRVAAYAGEADGEHTGAIAGWTGAGELWTSLTRWVAGEEQGLGDDVLVTQDVDEGTLRVRVHLDPERTADPFASPPRLRLLRGLPGRAPREDEAALRWVDPDLLEATLVLDGDEVALATVDAPGLGRSALPAVRLPYSPEHAPAEPGEGRLQMEAWARATGGRARLDVGEVWSDFPRRARPLELTPWLLALAALLVLLEVLERRTAWVGLALAGVRARLARRREPSSEVATEEPLAAPRPASAPRRPPATASPEPRTAAPPPATPEPDTLVDALAKARRRGSARTERPR